MCDQILDQVVPIKPLCSDGFSQTDTSDKDGWSVHYIFYGMIGVTGPNFQIMMRFSA